MQEQDISGSCLCGEVSYKASPPFKGFQYCHCMRCRKKTGTAHAANIFVPPEQFEWTKGEENVQTYNLPDAKYFANSFCKICGSALPWLTQPGNNRIVTAGTIDEGLEIKPSQSIFWADRADWYESTCDIAKHEQLPIKKK